MDNPEFLLYYALGALAGFAIWAFIVIEIIKYATRDLRHNAELQTKLLTEIAKVQGVNEHRVKEIISVPEKPAFNKYVT